VCVWGMSEDMGGGKKTAKQTKKNKNIKKKV
jgi:hypothetical protein